MKYPVHCYIMATYGVLFLMSVCYEYFADSTQLYHLWQPTGKQILFHDLESLWIGWTDWVGKIKCNKSQNRTLYNLNSHYNITLKPYGGRYHKLTVGWLQQEDHCMLLYDHRKCCKLLCDYIFHEVLYLLSRWIINVTQLLFIMQEEIKLM